MKQNRVSEANTIIAEQRYQTNIKRQYERLEKEWKAGASDITTSDRMAW